LADFRRTGKDAETMKKGIKWINRGLITSPYFIGLCRSEKDFKRELKRLKVPRRNWPEWIKDGKDGCCHYLEKRDTNDLCCIVCIKITKETKKAAIIGLLVHESVHIWHAVRDELNEKDPSNEFEAYSIQCIAQRLISAL
jgi:hypothetical protein